ncbi:hypothetical protein P4O66_018396 [Electrophorus voltai]|uniref:Dual specificity protein phosphatase 15 n=1 Tax=Electrophorus voltai TaxID=2609070 RepID=A0AAD8YPL2_9TELE|nr:hypothetical protein P4O66_018396 [Electrophorus voltai]
MFSKAFYMSQLYLNCLNHTFIATVLNQEKRIPFKKAVLSQFCHQMFVSTDSENRESLSQNGITHILSVYNNAKPVLEVTHPFKGFSDMTYLCIHAADASNQNLLQHFKECICFIHECRLNGGSCLVHCLAGVSRSTTVVVAYLMTVTTHGWEECLSAVKAVRSFVGPNYGFQQQLQQFQMTQLSELRVRVSLFLSLSQYRAWLRASYRSSPFKDQEQVAALLGRYAEQQAQERRRRGERDWMNQASSLCSAPYHRYNGSGCNR